MVTDDRNPNWFDAIQGLTRKCWELATEVTKTNERVNTQAQVSAKGKVPRAERAQKVRLYLQDLKSLCCYIVDNHNTRICYLDAFLDVLLHFKRESLSSSTRENQREGTGEARSGTVQSLIFMHILVVVKRMVLLRYIAVGAMNVTSKHGMLSMQIHCNNTILKKHAHVKETCHGANSIASAITPSIQGTKKFFLQGTIEYARQQLEHYRNQLENRTLSRFDKAEAKKDLTDMAACATVMREMENSQSSSLLIQVLIPHGQLLKRKS